MKKEDQCDFRKIRFATRMIAWYKLSRPKTRDYEVLVIAGDLLIEGSCIGKAASD